MHRIKYRIPLKQLILTQKGAKPLILKNYYFPNSIPYLDISVLESGQIKEYTYEQLGKLSTKEDILVVWDGSRSGLAFMGKVGAVGSTLMSLTPIKMDSEYLYFFLKSKFEFLNDNVIGSGIPHVDPKIFYELEVPYVSLLEQQEIIRALKNKIKENSSILSAQRTSIENLLSSSEFEFDKNEDLNLTFKNFRQSILEKAVSGELTKNWRNQNRDFLDFEGFKTQLLEEKLKNLSQKDNLETFRNEIKSSKIENDRFTLKADLFCSTITKGSTPKAFHKKGIPFLKVYNIVDDEINFNYKPQYILSETHNTALKRSKVFPNDVLLNIVGPPLGKVALVPNDFKEWNINQAIVVFRCLNVVLPDFLYILLLEGSVIRNVLPQTKGDAGQTNISIKQCKEFTFSIPTTSEQEEIIKRVKNMFSLVRSVNTNYQEALMHFVNLEKSLLSEAFDIERIDDNQEIHYHAFLNELNIEKKRLENQKSNIQKSQSEFKKKYFMNNSIERIKEEIKRISFEKYKKMQISQESRTEIFNRTRDVIPTMDFDDFSSAFQILAQDKLKNETDQQFFKAEVRNGKLFYTIINTKNEAPITEANK